MLEFFPFYNLLKKDSDIKGSELFIEHIYNSNIHAAVTLDSFRKPRWQNNDTIYDVLSIQIQSLNYSIVIFRSHTHVEMSFLQIECPKEYYGVIPQEQRINLKYTQEFLRNNDLFAPCIDNGHFIQLQIPIQDCKHLIIKALMQDLMPLAPETNIGALISFDIVFFMLFDYAYFCKPEMQVLHVLTQDYDDYKKLEKIQEIIDVVNAPAPVLFKKLIDYTTAEKISLPSWFMEMLCEDPEMGQDEQIIEASYQSFAAILDHDTLKKLPWKELIEITRKAVSMIYTLNIDDKYSIITALIKELAQRNGCRKTPNPRPHVRMNVEAFNLFIDILTGFRTNKK